MINFNDFQKIEIKIGEVLSAEKVEGSENYSNFLLILEKKKPRQVISGIAKTFTAPQKLIGKQFTFVTNLETRSIMGLESQAMILATHKQKENRRRNSFDETAKKVPSGSKLG